MHEVGRWNASRRSSGGRATKGDVAKKDMGSGRPRGRPRKSSVAIKELDDDAPSSSSSGAEYDLDVGDVLDREGDQGEQDGGAVGEDAGEEMAVDDEAEEEEVEEAGYGPRDGDDDDEEEYKEEEGLNDESDEVRLMRRRSPPLGCCGVMQATVCLASPGLVMSVHVIPLRLVLRWSRCSPMQAIRL